MLWQTTRLLSGKDQASNIGLVDGGFLDLGFVLHALHASATSLGRIPPDFTRVQPHTSRQDVTRQSYSKPTQQQRRAQYAAAQCSEAHTARGFNLGSLQQAVRPPTAIAPAAAAASPIRHCHCGNATCPSSLHACIRAAGNAALTSKANSPGPGKQVRAERRTHADPKARTQRSAATRQHIPSATHGPPRPV